MRASSATLTTTERIIAGAAAAVLAVTVVGVSLWPVTTPLAVEILVRAVGADTMAGVSSDAVYENAEAVRRFVIDRSAPALPEAVEGAPGFDAAAVSHLIDVREILIPSRWLTLALTIIAGVWIAFGLRRNDRSRLITGRSLVYAGTGLIAAGTLALVVGALDFDALFTWFHGLFFADGTWTFPDSALLIRIFPLPFWIAAGALWAGIAVAAAVTLVLVGRSDYFTPSTDGV